MENMLNFQVIGVGAAGNKATLQLIKDQVVSREDVFLINSTDKDIPEDFKSNGRYKVIGDGIDGCGQERSKGRDIAYLALQNHTLDLEAFLKPTTDAVIVITSTEGGTGSGASVVISQFLKDVLDMDVIVFAITGFSEFPRNIWNTIEFFQDMQDSYHIEILSNKNFLSECRGNHLKAEIACNEEISRRVMVLSGQLIKPAEQNIDSRDLKKLSIEPGWGNVEYYEIDEKVKSQTHFTQLVNDMLDNTKSMESTKSQKKLGVMVNLSERELNYVDYGFEEIMDKYGTPYEIYKHIQHLETKHFIAIISSGMKLPIEEFEELYELYTKKTESIDTGKDAFFSKIAGMNKSDNDSIFDLKEKNLSQDKVNENKKNFFANMKLTSMHEAKPIKIEDDGTVKDVKPNKPASIRDTLKGSY